MELVVSMGAGLARVEPLKMPMPGTFLCTADPVREFVGVVGSRFALARVPGADYGDAAEGRVSQFLGFDQWCNVHALIRGGVQGSMAVHDVMGSPVANKRSGAVMSVDLSLPWLQSLFGPEQALALLMRPARDFFHVIDAMAVMYVASVLCCAMGVPHGGTVQDVGNLERMERLPYGHLPFIGATPHLDPVLCDRDDLLGEYLRAVGALTTPDLNHWR